jgi:hypothetical protein
LAAAKLNENLRGVLQIMVGDIRRAGFNANAAGELTPSTYAAAFNWSRLGSANPQPVNSAGASIENPHMVPGSTNVTVTNAATGSNNCILYSYDLDLDGAVDANENYGFRQHDGGVQIRKTQAAACGDTGSANWESIIDTDVIVIDDWDTGAANDGFYVRILGDGVSGTPDSQCENTSTGVVWSSLCTDTTVSGYAAPSTGDRLVELRLVEIRLRGYIANDPAVRKEVRSYVKLRNDRLIKAP